MKLIVRLLAYARRHMAALVAAFLLALAGAAMELAKPWPIKVVIDYGLAGEALPSWLAAVTAWLPGAGTQQGLVAWSAGAALLIAWLGAALSFLVMGLVIHACQRMVYQISLDLFDKLQRLSISYHGSHPVGDLLQRMGGDVFAIHFAISQVAIPGSISLITLVGMFIVMAQIDLSLSLIALGVVPLLAGSLLVFAGPMDRANSRQYEGHGKVMSLVEQSLTAIRAIQGFAREDFIRKKVAERSAQLADDYGAATMVSAGYKEITTILTGSAAAAILWFGSMRVMSGQMTVGDLWVFLGYLAALYGPVNLLSMAVVYAVQVNARARRVFEVMDAPEMVLESPDAIDVGRARGEITFDNVSFAYGARAGEEPRAVLQNVTLRAAAGQITAIVGPTGAGKTTLMSLISRFHDPTTGRVLLDGCDLRKLKLLSLRENVALVLQEPFLFALSAGENIAFGKPDATREEIIAAAKAARAHDFITRLPQGYDTVLGEKGATLSGGEKQRLSIARALIKDAPVLILDEPTSSLDAHTEALIFEALTEAMRNKTVFIISHRLSTIKRADQIFAMDDGRIVECGTHADLMAKGELYARLYRLQHLAAQ